MRTPWPVVTVSLACLHSGLHPGPAAAPDYLSQPALHPGALGRPGHRQPRHCHHPGSWTCRPQACAWHPAQCPQGRPLRGLPQTASLMGTPWLAQHQQRQCQPAVPPSPHYCEEESPACTRPHAAVSTGIEDSMPQAVPGSGPEVRPASGDLSSLGGGGALGQPGEMVYAGIPGFPLGTPSLHCRPRLPQKVKGLHPSPATEGGARARALKAAF